MGIRFNGADELREAVQEFVRENVDTVIEALFSGDLADKLAERMAGQEPAAPSVPEPQVHSVVSFTNRSPSDGVTRSYSAFRTSRGWQTSSGTSRLPKDATWEQIVAFANGKVDVLRDGTVKV